MPVRTAHLLKRFVAVLYMAQCLVLSAQGTLVVLDQVQHLFRIEHAPNAIAGDIFAPVDHHEHDLAPVGHHGDHGPDTGSERPKDHQHVGEGMLAPWFGVPSYDLAHAGTLVSSLPDAVITPDKAFYKRHDRPPKGSLV